ALDEARAIDAHVARIAKQNLVVGPIFGDLANLLAPAADECAQRNRHTTDLNHREIEQVARRPGWAVALRQNTEIGVVRLVDPQQKRFSLAAVEEQQAELQRDLTKIVAICPRLHRVRLEQTYVAPEGLDHLRQVPRLSCRQRQLTV